MLCCFLSNRRFAVKFNGEFLGLAGNNLCGANVCAKNAFFEFIPACSRFLPVSLFLNDDFADKCAALPFGENFSARASKSSTDCGVNDEDFLNGVSFINSGDGLLFFIKFRYAPPALKKESSPFKTITAQSGNKAFFFYSGGTFCFIESASGGGDYFKLCEDFPLNVSVEDYKERFIIIKIMRAGGEKNEVFIFDLSATDKPKLVLKRLYDELFIGDDVVTVLKTPSVTKIEKRESFNLTAPEKSYKIFTRETPLEYVNERLLPFAFLEELALGAHFEDYLSEELKAQKDLVAEFLGKFDFFLPKLYKNSEETAILIENKKIRRLSISLFRRLITDLNFI